MEDTTSDELLLLALLVFGTWRDIPDSYSSENCGHFLQLISCIRHTGELCINSSFISPRDPAALLSPESISINATHYFQLSDQ